MVIKSTGWPYIKIVSVDDILFSTRQLFWGVVGLIFLTTLISAMFISIQLDRTIIQRIGRLVEAMRLYQSGVTFNLSDTIAGSDEISVAAKEFDTMAVRINQNIFDIKAATDTLKESE